MKPRLLIYLFFVSTSLLSANELLIYNVRETSPFLTHAEGGYATRGIEFTVGNQPFTVGHLGFLDDYEFIVSSSEFQQPGLSADQQTGLLHEVGLYTAEGILLFKVAIEPGTAPLYYQNYRWKKLDEPIVLEANTRYMLAGSNFSWSKGGEFYNSKNADLIQTSDAFVLHQAGDFAWSSNPRGLVYPDRIRDGRAPSLIVNLGGTSNDFDKDGVLDSLEESVFGGFNSDLSSDRDKDGSTDIEEAVAGTDYSNFSSSPSVVWVVGQDMATLSPSTVAAGRRYTLRSSSDLVTWEDIESIDAVDALDEIAFNIDFDDTGGSASRFYTIAIDIVE